MVGQTEKSRASRRRLLDAATAALVEGEGAFGLKAVAAQAGVSVGLIYARFGSKAGLAASVVDAFYDRLQEAIHLPGSGSLPWHERERERIRRLVEFLYRDPLTNIVFGPLEQDPGVAAIATQRWNDLIDLGTRNVAHGQARGEIPADREPAVVSAIINGGLRHGLQRALSSPRPPGPQQLFEEIWAFTEGGLKHGGALHGSAGVGR